MADFNQINQVDQPDQPAGGSDRAAAFYRESWTFETSGPFFMKPISFDGFEKPSHIYNHDLARLSMAFTAGTYTHEAMQLTFEGFGFENIRLYNYDINDTNKALQESEAACAFATRALKIGDSEKKILAVAVRGSIGIEMPTNFEIEHIKGSFFFHNGFRVPTEYVVSKLRGYIEETGLELADCKILITGHSRGAAIADFIAIRLNAGLINDFPVAQEDIFAYTFGTPNSVSREGPGISLQLQKNIFNIINFQDAVGHLPGKYFSPGVNLYINNYYADNYSNYLAVFKRRYNALVSSAEYAGWGIAGNLLMSRLDRIPCQALAKPLGSLVTALTCGDQKQGRRAGAAGLCLGLGFVGAAGVRKGWTGAVCAGLLAKELAGGGKRITDIVYTNHVTETYLCLMEISDPEQDFYLDPVRKIKFVSGEEPR